MICYDAEFPEACRHVVAMGADLIIMPSVLSEHWGIVSEKMVPTRALKTAYLFVTLTSAERKMDGLILAAVVLSPPAEKELARAGETESHPDCDS